MSARVVPRGLPISRCRIGSRNAAVLPLPGHRAGEDVLARERGRNRVVLDGRRAREAHLLDPAQELGVETKFRKRHELVFPRRSLRKGAAPLKSFRQCVLNGGFAGEAYVRGETATREGSTCETGGRGRMAHLRRATQTAAARRFSTGRWRWGAYGASARINAPKEEEVAGERDVERAGIAAIRSRVPRSAAPVGRREQVGQPAGSRRAEQPDRAPRHEREMRRRLLARPAGAVASASSTEHRLAELDQIVLGGHGDEEAASARQDAAHLGPVAPGRDGRVTRSKEPSFHGREAVRVPHDPRRARVALRRRARDPPASRCPIP